MEKVGSERDELCLLFFILGVISKFGSKILDSFGILKFHVSKNSVIFWDSQIGPLCCTTRQIPDGGSFDSPGSISLPGLFLEKSSC